MFIFYFLRLCFGKNLFRKPRQQIFRNGNMRVNYIYFLIDTVSVVCTTTPKVWKDYIILITIGYVLSFWNGTIP